jgi:sugar/nucleoside kinase (ribokinase family)
VIVVVGDPVFRVSSETTPGAAAGRAVAIARAAAADGAAVQIVGKVGVDPTADALLIDLARAGIGHAAILRDPARRTPTAAPAVEASPIDPGLEGDAAAGWGAAEAESGVPPKLDAADLELGLRYLTAFGVLVIAEPLAADVLAVATEAAAYAGAELVVVAAPGGRGATAKGAAPTVAGTVLEAPSDGADDQDDRFAALVGRYAAALDAGTPAGDAFRDALKSSGWEAAPADA